MDNERLKRHLGYGKTIKIIADDGKEDEFCFKQLTPEWIPLYCEYEQLVAKNDSKSALEILVTLAEATVKISYPEWKEEDVDNFVANNFIIIVNIIREINTLGLTKSKELMERIQDIRGRMNASIGSGENKKPT